MSLKRTAASFVDWLKDLEFEPLARLWDEGIRNWLFIVFGLGFVLGALVL